MPHIIASQDFTSYDTKTIRNLLGLNPRVRTVFTKDGTEVETDIIGSRILRVIISKELHPISELRGKHFLGAFFEIQQCHYKVWKSEIHHNDPSLSNFMYRKEGKKGEVIIGVLNDWDLAIDMQSNPQHHGLERTGTVPYMALDLLVNRQGQIQHLYRHDHEATIWIATWVFLCYANGKYVGNLSNPQLAHWQTGSYQDCANLKSGFLTNHLLTAKPQEEWEEEWDIISELLADLNVRLANRNQALTRQRSRKGSAKLVGGPMIVEADDPDNVLRQQWAIIEGVAAENPELVYVLRYKPDFEVEGTSV
ncbi:hypothetical protein K474DRAFT_1631793 [Panus rudis PR-1116 ss-1]|nr:hypothetical protein K474DRAFT_1631793 [Panus rudis PR-1116 ss-1]